VKIIKASYQILTPIDGEEILQTIESAGRICYKSEKRITKESSESFVKNLLNRQHETPLEHISISVKFVCDRGILAEITRHRIASFNVESTRYCNYSKDKFGGELTFIEPCFWHDYPRNMINKPDTYQTEIYMYTIWKNTCQKAEKAYLQLLEEGATPQEARSILPNSLKTEIIMTANLREWRHFFKLRTAIDAHPQMREITIPLLNELKEKIPIIFDDIQGGNN